VRRAVIALMLPLAGCGSAPESDLPPVPAGAQPAETRTTFEDGRGVAVLRPRARVVETFDARTQRRTGRVAVGVGPTRIASNGGETLYVVDTAGDGLVVVRTRPSLAVSRRVAFPGGGPAGIAVDRRRERIWVALERPGEVAELRAGTRPGILALHPAGRSPRGVMVDEATGAVTVRPAGGAPPRPLPTVRTGRR
jgi:DNA-binding beta-propeller fold protein YncE